VIKAGFRKPNGACSFVYWAPTNIMTTDFEATITVEVAALKGDPRLIDMMTGNIYTLPDTMIEKITDTCYKLVHIPIKDYPLLLTFGDF
jgi:hypothetical protein